MTAASLWIKIDAIFFRRKYFVLVSICSSDSAKRKVFAYCDLLSSVILCTLEVFAAI